MLIGKKVADERSEIIVGRSEEIITALDQRLENLTLTRRRGEEEEKE